MDDFPTSYPAATDPVAFDVRTRRVLELRRQIEAGTYAVDHALVAAAILREHFAIEPALAPSAPTVVGATPSVREFSRFVVPPATLGAPGTTGRTATA